MAIDESLYLYDNQGKQIWIVGAVDTKKKTLRLDIIIFWTLIILFIHTRYILIQEEALALDFIALLQLKVYGVSLKMKLEK